jgi:hypothetical protein
MAEQMFMMKSEVDGQPPVVSDDLVSSVNQRICERRHSTISELLCEFPQISPILLYEIMTVRLGCHNKFCERRVPKMIAVVHKTQRMTSVFVDFLEQYHKDGNQFLNHIM